MYKSVQLSALLQCSLLYKEVAFFAFCNTSVGGSYTCDKAPGLQA